MTNHMYDDLRVILDRLDESLHFDNDNSVIAHQQRASVAEISVLRELLIFTRDALVGKGVEAYGPFMSLGRIEDARDDVALAARNKRAAGTL